MAQISALGCKDVLTTPAAQDVKVGADNFDGSQVNPETLWKAKQVWVLLITNCKRRLRDRSKSGLAQPGLALARAALQSEWCQGMATVGTGLLLDEDGTRWAPETIFLALDRLVKEMDRVGRPTLGKDIDIVLLTGLSSQYDAEVRMVESSADWPDRARIERAVYNQYDRLTREKSEAGPKALASVSRLVSPPRNMPVLFASGAYRGELQKAGIRQTQTEAGLQARQPATARRQS